MLHKQGHNIMLLSIHILLEYSYSYFQMQISVITFLYFIYLSGLKFTEVSCNTLFVQNGKY